MHTFVDWLADEYLITVHSIRANMMSLDKRFLRIVMSY